MRLLIALLILNSLISCNVGQKTDSREEKFKKTVTSLRQVGLFADYKNLDDNQLAKVLIEKAKEKYRTYGVDEFNQIFDPLNNEYFDLHVAELDDTRVWWRDLEADVLEGNNVYASTVNEFGRLSGGYLNPEQIKEEWISSNGPVKVSFLDKGSLRVINLKSNDDWYDMDFFKNLEYLIKSNGSPYSLFMHDQTGQDVFVIRLTLDEKEKIEKKMNWNLVKF